MTADERAKLAEQVARCARDRDLTVAVAESLTGGLVVSALGAAGDASEWLRGGVVAYATAVKQKVLAVSPGPVVSARCAEEMAAGVAAQLDADAAVATTGVGGPDSEEGRDPGTVYIGWWVHGQTGSRLYTFDGTPEEVLDATVAAALTDLLRAMDAAERRAS
ncbi:CinA family protein [Microbacterium sp. ZW CA_36]|uniref:CinA family protein n=1 Tax=Microbacterium sp. ZW CA_36 TaxID=3378078 RepID=UPI0038528DAF